MVHLVHCYRLLLKVAERRYLVSTQHNTLKFENNLQAEPGWAAIGRDAWQ